tara:strand:- start:7497 stop:7988 length:492 start_codon:yes stop_codon:yes gene_type:complete
MYTGGQELLFIKIDEAFLPIICLTNHDFNESSDFLDTTTRDNGGWKTSIPTNQSYSISGEGAIYNTIHAGGNFGAVSYDKLQQLKRNRTMVEWRTATTDLVFVETGFAYIQELGRATPVDDLITFSFSLVGFGKPESSTEALRTIQDGNGNNIKDGNDNNIIG